MDRYASDSAHRRCNEPAQAGLLALPRANVRASIPRVARSAPSDMTGKMPASFQTGSMVDQS
jgi:hypothetical protein